MTSEETNKPHQKHAKLTKPNLGLFGRHELAIVGTSCANIKKLADKIIAAFASLKVAYVDADHKSADGPETNNSSLANGGFLEYTDKISFQRIDFKGGLNAFEKRTLFNEQDLIIVNGNHFKAKSQLVVIDPVKNIEKKIDQLDDVRMILVKEADAVVPDFLQKLSGFDAIPIRSVEDQNGIITFVRKFLDERIPPVNGLVLSGGQSTRMKRDKGSLSYHGITQREYLYQLLLKHCEKVFVSCNAQQVVKIADQFPIIQDKFLGLGPVGGILSALQTDPNAAWLTVACDLPYLTEKTIERLIQNRNPFKSATAFLDPTSQFPEPLISIWEPKSNLTLLQFLAQGYSCPRKALINSDIELLETPDVKEFLNANSPEEYERALGDLTTTDRQ